MLSVIIPAHDEAAWIGACLDALLAQDPAPQGGVEIIVAANGCTDDTAAIARTRIPVAEARGWRLQALDIPEGGKPNALDRGDAAASGGVRVYLDADVTCAPGMLAALADALAVPAPRFASGRLTVAPAKSRITRRYARIWTRLPFMAEGVPGAGLFAVNAAGRARWGDWPRIISDDTFARLQFSPEERIGVEVPYAWPMVEGWGNLVRVRRRQNAGVREIAERWPEAMAREGKRPLGLSGAARLALSMPLDFAVYAGVSLAVSLTERLGARAPGEWSRGR